MKDCSMQAPSAESGRMCPPGLLRSEKIGPRHLERLACVYIRQSTPQRVIRNRESTQVQYSLARRATELGWPSDRVDVIDDDLGKSGASSEGRVGFQRLVTEVSLNHVGIILGVEMSRLARCCKDWYQLLDVCGVFGTLIADLDGIYDPSQYNDRLLLGLKGTMSEAELHIIKQRMYQGVLNKARRGEFVTRVPMGYVLRRGEVILDPDEEVQAVMRLVFQKFEELGSIHATLRFLADHGIKLPIRQISGPAQGEVEWRRVRRVTLQSMLKNPTYAGAYVYGRRATDPRLKRPGHPGTGQRTMPPDQWKVFLRDRYPAYITWDQFQAHQERIRSNRNVAHWTGTARVGTALLCGLLVCGKCGARMTVHYRKGDGEHDYSCSRLLNELGGTSCQRIAGRVIDDLVTQQVLKALEPASLDLSLQAAENIERQRNDLDQVWQKRLERVRFEAGRAQRHYECLEPEHRLVARELARQWEEKLGAQREAEEEYDRFRRTQPRLLTSEEREAVRLLAADIPSLWSAKTTRESDRKEILRLVIDRVRVDVVDRSEHVCVAIEWAGGTRTEHEVLRPVARIEYMSYWPQLASRVREMTDKGLKIGEMVDQLEAEGWKTAHQGTRFKVNFISQLLKRLGLRPRHAIRKDRSELHEHEEWLSDLARKLGINKTVLFKWIYREWIPARRGRDEQWIVRADPEIMARIGIIRNAPRGHRARREYLERHSLQIGTGTLELPR